jgi:hypothetical protein
MKGIETGGRRGSHAVRGLGLRLVPTLPAQNERRWVDRAEDSIELRVAFRELVLIHKSLEAVRILGLVARQDDVLTDTLQLIDVALKEAR